MKKQNAFTMTELVIIIIVIGLLATLALPRYNCQVEKSRRAEAYQILGSIRDDAKVYEVEHGSLAGFQIDPTLPGAQCAPGHYFSYGQFDINNRSVSAKRCGVGEGGKAPGYSENYTIDINLDTGVLTPNGPSCLEGQDEPPPAAVLRIDTPPPAPPLPDDENIDTPPPAPPLPDDENIDTPPPAPGIDGPGGGHGSISEIAYRPEPVDVDGDGVTDFYRVDTNDDGVPDFFIADVNNDGNLDTLYDTDGDRLPDCADTDGDDKCDFPLDY